MHDSSSGTDAPMHPRAAARIVVLVLVVGASILACQGRREFTVVDTRGTTGLTILVRDETGWVRGAQLSDAMVAPLHGSVGLSSPEGQPNILRVGWYDNGCPETATMTIVDRGDRLAISVEKGWTRCINDMAVGHAVDLYFDRPVDAARAEGSLSTAPVTPEPRPP